MNGLMNSNIKFDRNISETCRDGEIDWDEIDWKDKSGLIAFLEWEKRNEIRKIVSGDLIKVTDFSLEDWILILIHSNDNSLRKTTLRNFLLIFSERTGINFLNSCNYCFVCPGAIENTLKDLIYKGRLELEIGKDNQGIIFKNYNIKDKFWVKNLYEFVPDTIKRILLELKEEFEDKNVIEIVNYVNDAYPEYMWARTV